VKRGLIVRRIVPTEWGFKVQKGMKKEKNPIPEGEEMTLATSKVISEMYRERGKK